MTALGRSAAAELVRLGGRRGPLLLASLPLGLVLPLLVSLAVAAVAETLHGDSGDGSAGIGEALIRVREVGTTNSLFWVISLGVTVHAVVAAYAQSTSTRGAAGELRRHVLPRTGADLCGRWLVTGIVAGCCSLAATVILLLVLPRVFPGVYGTVDVASAEGLRFLWAVPAYAVAASGIGVGVGALVRVPAASVAVLTLWSLLVESAVTYIPGGAEALGWMPFLNGQYATGQEIALAPAWGPDGALLYVFVVATVLVGLGAVRLGAGQKIEL
ncbi:hypothetical protein [Corynebacterium provencense]|jgi:hypothetical protein|uniref:hypothetical protein n=1 Tax=Corynebacterium provencense TaxID=1737425 RepID=UPI002989DF5D